jgi:hypothetical protein
MTEQIVSIAPGQEQFNLQQCAWCDGDLDVTVVFTCNHALGWCTQHFEELIDPMFDTAVGEFTCPDCAG